MKYIFFPVEYSEVFEYRKMRVHFIVLNKRTKKKKKKKRRHIDWFLVERHNALFKVLKKWSRIHFLHANILIRWVHTWLDVVYYNTMLFTIFDRSDSVYFTVYASTRPYTTFAFSWCRYVGIDMCNGGRRKLS